MNSIKSTIFINHSIDLIDQALLRPGRFDKLLYIGPPEEKTEQLKILEALTRKFQVDPNVDLMTDVVCEIPNSMTLTGADFYALTVDTMMAAIDRLIGTSEKNLILKKEDFLLAITNIKPSVSIEEMIYYKSVQNKVIEK